MKIIYRRKLPHKFYPGYTFFITWNLKGAIPKTVIDRLIAERDEALRQLASDKNISPQTQLEMALEIGRKFFFEYNNHLDQVHPESPLWLKIPEVAELVAKRLHEFDQKYYRLIAYCIMANHVHAVFDYAIQIPEENPDILPPNYKQVNEVMKLINGATAVQANRILGRSGKFWAEGYFDRYIRDEKHLFNSINYTLYNPVKAGICNDWRNYQFSFLAAGFDCL